jgi:hypothetical protein
LAVVPLMGILDLLQRFSCYTLVDFDFASEDKRLIEGDHTVPVGNFHRNFPLNQAQQGH